MSDLSGVTRIVDTREFYVPLDDAPSIKVIAMGTSTFRPTLAVITYVHDNVLGEQDTPRWRFWKIGLSGDQAGRIMWAGMTDLRTEAPEFYEQLRKAIKAVQPR